MKLVVAALVFLAFCTTTLAQEKPKVKLTHPPKLTHQVKPAYPADAKAARIQGQVVLMVTIDKEGAAADVRVAKGDPMLVNAAIDAVKQWRWEPVLLNGKPVSAETSITVNFVLPEPPKTDS